MRTKSSNNLQAWLEIDRQKIRRNLEEIRRLTKNAPILAMVKANAYGMGLLEATKVLKDQGIKSFGVVGIAEALKLRALDEGITIANFQPIEQNELRKTIENNITPVISKPEDFFLLKKLENSLRKKIGVFLKVNTGLNRWGFSYKETLSLAKNLIKSQKIRIDALVTTLVEYPQIDYKQIVTLLRLKRDFESLGIEILNISFASSQGILTLNLKDFGLIRPGIALYGIYPDERVEKERKILLEPVFSLKTKISQIRKIRKGERVLYKKTFFATKETVIGVLPLGYQFGYNPLFQGKAQVLIEGKRCLVIGISMSATVIDLSKIDKPRTGQEAVLIGKQGEEEITLEELTRISGLSPYYLMTALPKNLSRIYLN